MASSGGVADASPQSDAKEKFVAGVDESDKYADSCCVISGDDGADETEDPGEAADAWAKKSLSREVDAEA